MSLAAQITLLATRIGNTLRDTVMPRVQPAGGTTGQVLTKTSATNYASAWQTPAANAAVGGTKTFARTSGVVTSITGPGSDSITFTYVNGLQTKVVKVVGSVTTTTNFSYTSGVLDTVTKVIT
jgi:hypothetical protein